MDDLTLPKQMFDSPGRSTVVKRLLAWFDAHARDLPWRKTRDLYAIWVSEVMLQQTQVATVIPYYERLLAAFPDVRSLASAPEQRVLKLWEGLGYYRRARQLHAAAQKVLSDFGGRFPQSFDEVRSLPGIGRYTAGAILSIGLDQRLPILEANTIRVLSRLAAFRGDTASSAGQKFLWAAAERLLPKRRCGAFNQALMELGSEICTARSPQCERCPLVTLCPTKQLALQSAIPAPKKPKQYEEVTQAAVVIRRGGKVLLRQCAKGERWAGLWDFPRFEVPADVNGQLARHIAEQTAALTGVRIGRPREVATLKHGVTRFRITLAVLSAAPLSPPRARKSAARGIWVALSDLGNYPLSTTGRKIAGLIAAE